MISILYLIPVSLALGVAALLGFFWSVKTGQYDNMESDAYRVLTADDVPMGQAERLALEGKSED